EKLLERTEQELLGEPVAPMIQDPLPQSGTAIANGEVRFVARNDFRKTFRILASELNVPDRRVVGQVYTLDYLTQIRRLTREVRMQDRLRSEEHTSELQSRGHLVCRLLLEEKE